MHKLHLLNANCVVLMGIVVDQFHGTPLLPWSILGVFIILIIGHWVLNREDIS